MLGELVAPVDEQPSARVTRQVARIMAEGHTEVALARLLTQLQRALGEPRQVRPVAINHPRDRKTWRRCFRWS